MAASTQRTEHHGEQGFMLLAVIVGVFLVLLALGIAAPRVAQDLRRVRELQTIERGNQYVRAIRLYYRKFGRYPASMDVLEKSNNIRFLRQRYVDPMTGKEDWRLIHVGEAKTTVKGFFGQPLAGLPGSTGGLGSAAGMSSNISGSSSSGAASTPGSAIGSSSTGMGGTNSLGSSQPYTLGGASSTPGSTTPGSSTPTGGAGASDGSSNSLGGISSQSASTFSGGGQPFVGIGVPKDGTSITVLNEQTTYQTWEFVYDPRIEQMYAKAALLGGSPANSGGTLGTSPNQLGSPLGNSPSGTNPTSPATPSSPTTGTPSSNPQ